MSEESNDSLKVLFVCLGNICRSPMAEGIFNHLISENELNSSFHVDSAGTGGYHNGETYHRHTLRVCKQNSVPLDGISRELRVSDFIDFDYLVAMDRSNFEDMLDKCPSVELENKIVLMRDYQPGGVGKDSDVPDPYYGGVQGFDRVFEILMDACGGFLNDLKKNHSL
jgi:protein-tyrosine phosphatase